MPGFFLHVGATVLCAHGGMAQPSIPNPRVTVSGMPTVTQPGPYLIAGCSFPPPPIANGPCVTGMWVMAALRVTSNGLPLLLHDSQAICVPTGTPLTVAVTQMRAKGM